LAATPSSSALSRGAGFADATQALCCWRGFACRLVLSELRIAGTHGLVWIVTPAHEAPTFDLVDDLDLSFAVPRFRGHVDTVHLSQIFFVAPAGIAPSG
jgi:hypothetical protein